MKTKLAFWCLTAIAGNIMMSARAPKEFQKTEILLMTPSKRTGRRQNMPCATKTAAVQGCSVIQPCSHAKKSVLLHISLEGEKFRGFVSGCLGAKRLSLMHDPIFLESGSLGPDLPVNGRSESINLL